MGKWTPYWFRTDESWDDCEAVSDDKVGSVLAVGDLHGSEAGLLSAIEEGTRLGVDAIVQLGDCWLADRNWHDHDPEEASFMYRAAASPVPIVVVDGNHEAWPSLRRYNESDAATAAHDAGRPLHLGGSVWWARRGCVWSWSGLRFGALGGAVSLDRRERDCRRWRWDDEEPGLEDLERLMYNAGRFFDGDLDVLFTHDAPEQETNLVSAAGSELGYRVPKDLLRAASAVRSLLGSAVRATRASMLMHGHWHRSNYERIEGHCEAIGLSDYRADDPQHGHTALVHLDPSLRVDWN